jgi:hypothetical protein
MRTNLCGIFIVIYFARLMVAQSGQNLLFNGSFEQPAYSGDYYTYSSDFGFTLPGWTYPPGYNKFFLEYGQPFYPAIRHADGRQAVCLNGDGVPVSLSQTFATVSGHNYLLTFAQSDEQDGLPSTSALKVSVAGVTRTFTRANDYGWMFKSLQFTATNSSTALAFTDVSPTTPDVVHSPFLDAVSVVDGSASMAGTNTPIPGGTGNFTALLGNATLSGGNLAFFGSGTGGQTGLFARLNGTLLKIADLNTPIPGGSGNFTGFGGSVSAPTDPCISGDSAVFVGTGSGGQAGLYARISGSLVTIADTATAIPGGVGTFNAIPGDPCISGDAAAFIGAGTSGQQGIYLRAQPGDPSRLVANLSTAIPGGVGVFTAFPDPSLSGTNTVFVGSGSGGQQGVYAEFAGVLTRIADTNTPTAGATNHFIAFRSAVISGTNVAFIADSTNGLTGIYALWNGSLTNVADTATAIPCGTNNFTGFTNVSIDGSSVAFLATGGGGQMGIYYSAGGGLRKVVDLQDQIGGKTLTNLAFGRYGLSANQVAYTATYSDGTQDVQFTPVVPSPRPLIITSAVGVLNDVNLAFTTEAGSNYIVLSRTNLMVGGWTQLPGTNYGNGDTNIVYLPNSALPSQNFFRVQRVP